MPQSKLFELKEYVGEYYADDSELLALVNGALDDIGALKMLDALDKTPDEVEFSCCQVCGCELTDEQKEVMEESVDMLDQICVGDLTDEEKESYQQSLDWKESQGK